MKAYRLLVAVLILGLCFGTLFAQAPKWKLLGLKVVTFRTEKDVIVVGADEGVWEYMILYKADCRFSI